MRYGSRYPDFDKLRVLGSGDNAGRRFPDRFISGTGDPSPGRRRVGRVRDLLGAFLVGAALLLLTGGCGSETPAPTYEPGEGGDRRTGAPFATRSPVPARNGIAATSQPLATQTALHVLREGGTAVDAAIAANAVLGLVEPTMSGVGGDLYAIVWDPEQDSLYGLNASGRSPSGLSYREMEEELDSLEVDRIPRWGPLSVSVPGAVDGWFELHERFGTIPISEILDPAIRYAREGFPVTQIIAHDWERNRVRFLEEQRHLIPEVTNFRETFLIDGEAPDHGDVFRNPDLARTYERIASGGREAFYGGAIADTIHRYMERVGGYLTRDDLTAHTSTWVEPVSTTYRGYRVWELPPNGQGIAALQMLNVLEGFDLAAMGHNSADYIHHHVEAKKLAFADRAKFYADPQFADVPIRGLISKEYAERRREEIDPDRAMQTDAPGNPRLEGGDTVYLTVADENGMMVSLIQSNYWEMGSGLVPDGLGFMLQDRGALFSMEEGHANVYEPGKRPFHTIIPAFVTREGRPYMSFGVMGGAMQPQGHVQILCNIIDFGMNVQEAGDAARYRHTGSSSPRGATMSEGGTLYLERGVEPAVVRDLQERGHAIEVGPSYFGGYQGIRWHAEREIYVAGSEMRKDGHAGGY